MINVSCAIIKNAKDEILVTQRSEEMKLPLKWEFPGGKIEGNETEEECLIREIKEELGIDINIIIKLKPNIHNYDDFSIKLIPFLCEIKFGEVKLTEHANFLWLQKSDFHNLDWAEADIPIFKQFL